MSLLRPVIRACIVAALRDRTWAEDRVFDTDQRPLAAAVLNVPKSPYMVVFSDVDDMPNITEAQLYSGHLRSMQMQIEIGVASAIERQDGQVVIKFASSDYGSELACDVIETQVFNALYGDPQSDWGNLLKRFAPRIRGMRSRRGGQNQQGVRFNARRVILTLTDLLDDLAPGIVPVAAHPIWTFIEMAKLHTEENIVSAGTAVEKVINEMQSNAPEWRKAQALLGLSEPSIKALTVTDTPLPYPGIETPPYDAQDGDQPPLLEEIVLSQDDIDWRRSTADPTPDQ